MTTVEATTTYVFDTCPNCFVQHGFPQHLYRHALERKEGHTIYCPNGHTWCYTGKSKEQEIEELKLTIQRKDNTIDEIAREKQQLEARIKNGVCPYCNRMFKNMARHMLCKHKGKKV